MDNLSLKKKQKKKQKKTMTLEDEPQVNLIGSDLFNGSADILFKVSLF